MKLNIILLAIVTILIIYYWRLQVNKRGADGFSLKSCYNRNCESCPEGEEITSASECQNTNWNNYGYGYGYGYGGRYWGGTANWGASYPKNCWQSGNHRYFNTGGTKDQSYHNVQKVCKGGEREKKDGDPFIMDDASKPCPKGQEITNASECQKAHNKLRGNYGNNWYNRYYYNYYNYGYWAGSHHWQNSYPRNCWLHANHYGYFNHNKNASLTGTGSYARGNYARKICGGEPIEEAVGCPSDWEQVGEVGADIGGDGLGRSNEIKKISECAALCKDDDKCRSFTWAPMGGDKKYPNKRVCTRYSTDKATGTLTSRDDSTKTQVMCKQNIPLVTTETTNDFWKGISACGCDWTTKHSTANFDSAEYREGDYKWCFAPDSTHPSHKHNCENKTKHSMCRLNKRGHCISRYQVPKAEDQGTSKAFTNKVLKVKSNGMCLEADGGSGGSIKQKICSGEDNQLFSYNPKTLELKTKAGLCFDVKGGTSAQRGALIQTSPCKTTDNQANQRFYSEDNFFKPMYWYNNNSATPRDHTKGMCFSMKNADNVIGRELEQNVCTNSSYQQFEVTDDDFVRVNVDDPHPGTAIPDFDGHLKIQKYNGYWKDNFDFFKTATKVGGVKKVKAIHLMDEGARYSYKIWGVFSPPKTGLHYFKTNSDDSSVLWIAGEKVVDNAGLHPPRVRTGTISLVKGKQYPILMYFGENEGHAVLEFFWSSGAGWTKNLSNFFASQTYQDVPCAANFNGETFTIKRWTKVHGNKDEDVVITGGGHGQSEGVITIKAADVEKIKGSSTLRIYPKQPPGGNFHADPIKWRDTDNNGTLYLSTIQAPTPIRIHNNNRDCFQEATAIYVAIPLPEAVPNCREQTILAGRFVCTSCNTGYKKSQNGQDCNLIPIENCKTQNAGICTECNNAYDLSEDRKRCIKEAPQPPVLPKSTQPPENAPGIKGIKGPKGETGAQGNMGERGPKGRAAKASEVKGLPGLKGVKGVVGPKGPMGERGLVGERGHPGITGYQGKATIYDPWVDNRVVKQLRKMRDKLSDKNRELGFKGEGERKSVNVRLQMPRNTKKVIKKKILLKQEDDDSDIIEEFSKYPPGRYAKPINNTWGAFNNYTYIR